MRFPTIQRVRSDEGVTLAADVYLNDTDRPVVLLLHGGGQNRHAWAATSRVLHRAGYSVVAYDARGHGDSDWHPTGQYAIDDLARDLLHVREQFTRDRPVVVVGASMGGMTILVTHRIAPAELWAGVVLVDVTPRMEIEGARRVVGFMIAHPDGFATLEEAADVIAAYNPHRPRPDRLDGLTKVLRQRPDRRWVWRWDPAFMTNKLDDINTDTGDSVARFELMTSAMLDGARRITAPALLVRGALSDIVSADTVAEFISVVPHAETVDVSGTGHMVAGDDNDAFTTAVRDFLDRLPT